jgi:DUF1680 family protein
MSKKFSRRDFLISSAASGAIAAAPLGNLDLWARPHFADPGNDKAGWKLLPFPMTQVKLRNGLFKTAMENNRRYLHVLPNDRLLHTFRLTAGLPSTALAIGGWEAPDCELRGHLAGGHYLSACALNYASTGDEELKVKADQLVSELARCQAKLGSGYLGAYPSEFYDRLRDGKKVWAPFYTYHKIMSGHLDMYLYCGNQEALNTAEKMAAWAGSFVNPLTDEHLAKIQRIEHGGMNEVLFNLYAVTGKEEYLQLGRRFDHRKIFDPLAEGRDELGGNHANTNIPKIIGAVRGYELTGDQRYLNIADNFWKAVTTQHTYCTGGTSNGEYWQEAGKISTQLGPAAEECCCSYNMMKLTRHLYGLSGDPAKLDYYERLLYNTRLGSQDPDGMVMYFISMAPGLYRTFGTPYESFLCCTGTGIEEFAKTNDTIYFHDARGIYVNFFIASEVSWPEKGLKLVQDTAFPEEERTRLTISTAKPVSFALNLRVPYWAEKGAVIKVNGEVQHIATQPSTYAKLERVWKPGDKIEFALPMRLHVAPTPDDPTVQGMMYGPMVLAGQLGTQGLKDSMIYGPQGPEELKEGEKPAPPPRVKGSPKDATSWVEPISGKHQEFRAVGSEKPVTLVPFHKIFKERYTVYWKVDT